MRIHISHWKKLCGRPPKYRPAPCKLTFDLASGNRVTCDVGYLCANFSLTRPLGSRLRPDIRDRQTSDAHHRLMPPPYGGGGITHISQSSDGMVWTVDSTCPLSMATLTRRPNSIIMHDMLLTQHKQAVRVATQYAPAPLLPVGAPAPRAPPSRRNIAVVSHTRSHGHRCTAPASRVKAALSKAAW